MDQPAFVEVRKITIDNDLFEIEMTREFIERVRHRFGLAGDASLSDDQIRAFVSENIARVLGRAES